MPRIAFDKTFSVYCDVRLTCNIWVKVVFGLVCLALCWIAVRPQTVVRHFKDATATEAIRIICYADSRFCYRHLGCESDVLCEFELLKEELLFVQNIYTRESTHAFMKNSQPYMGNVTLWNERMQLLLDMEHAAKQLLTYYHVY